MATNTGTIKLSMVSAIARLKAGNLNTLSHKDLAALREAVVAHSTIMEFPGCEDALGRLAAEESVRKLPPPATDAAPPVARGGKRLRTAAGIAALVALLAGIGFFASWSRRHPDQPIAANSGTPPAARVVEISQSPETEPVVEQTTPEPEETENPAPPAAPETAMPTLAAAPEPAAPVGVQRPTIVVSGAGARLLDDPDGGFLLTPVNGADTVKLTGAAPRLVVSELNGECTLDLEDLQCPLIEFRGDINGVVKILVKSAGADVAFRGSIDGNPHVSMAVPGGKVRFFKEVHGSATLSLDVAGGEV